MSLNSETIRISCSSKKIVKSEKQVSMWQGTWPTNGRLHGKQLLASCMKAALLAARRGRRGGGGGGER